MNVKEDVKDLQVPDGDYLAPPPHVVTVDDQLLWLKIMFESQCPFIHLPQCSTNIIHRIKQARWAKDYIIFGQKGVSDCWFVKNEDI